MAGKTDQYQSEVIAVLVLFQRGSRGINLPNIQKTINPIEIVMQTNHVIR